MNLIQGSGDIEEGMDPGGFEIQQNLKRRLKVWFHFQACVFGHWVGSIRWYNCLKLGIRCVNQLVDEFSFGHIWFELPVWIY